MDAKKNLKSNQANLFDERKNFIVLKKIFIAIFIAFAVSLIILISYGFLLTYTDFCGERNLGVIIMIANIISVMLAGFDTARIFKNKGWFWGLFVGLIYFVILNIIGVIWFKKFLLTQENLFDCLIFMSSGSVGGIIGINFKK